MPPAPADPYRTLGVAPTASDEELRTAYRRLVQRHHPDHNGGSRESAVRFAEVQEAWAHVRLLRKRADVSAQAGAATAGSDPALEARLAAMEAELRAARGRREQAARAAKPRPAAPAEERPSDEELGYVTTQDSFSAIFDDVADEVSSRLAQAHDVPRSQATPRKPRGVADWIDELGSRLTGERPKRD